MNNVLIIFKNNFQQPVSFTIPISYLLPVYIISISYNISNIYPKDYEYAYAFNSLV